MSVTQSKPCINFQTRKARKPWGIGIFQEGGDHLRRGGSDPLPHYDTLAKVGINLPKNGHLTFYINRPFCHFDELPINNNILSVCFTGAKPDGAVSPRRMDVIEQALANPEKSARRPAEGLQLKFAFG